MTREIKFKGIYKNTDTGKTATVIYGINSKPHFIGNNYEWIAEDLQFVGLLDKYSKEIYEGDIIKQGDYIGRVTWNGQAYWATFPCGKHNDFLYVCRDNTEVIGNIYENSELLKEK